MFFYRFFDKFFIEKASALALINARFSFLCVSLFKLFRIFLINFLSWDMCLVKIVVVIIISLTCGDGMG